MSDGRFKANAVAGYERGERGISLERFSELCRLYGVPPNALLAEIMREVQGAGPLTLELIDLSSLGSEEAALVAGFVRHIRELRSVLPPDTIALRAGDLEVLATATGRGPAELRGHHARRSRTRPRRDQPQVQST